MHRSMKSWTRDVVPQLREGALLFPRRPVSFRRGVDAALGEFLPEGEDKIGHKSRCVMQRRIMETDDSD